ncbi:MAG TPA: helix-turn-helix domain-containing protein [Gammaproteobacteria bacterium]|nr:helix-turn-helix domain-containing protein [Gammaproteobacteria bacterium]
MSTKLDIEFTTLFKPSDLLTREEAAKYLRVSPCTLAVWASVKRYNLPYIKVGRSAKYRFADLENFIRQRTVTQQEL